MSEVLKTIVLQLVEKQPHTKAEFDDIRRQTCNALGVSQPPNRKLFSAYQTLIKKKRIKRQPNIERLFTKASVRSSSGIAVITSLLKPYACPGKCVYCPTEARMPKSYVASEPAAARSLRLNFDPYLLMQKRIEMLEQNGHPCDKIEYITKGGTWNAYPLKYQYWYIMESFKACNNFTRKNQVPHTVEEEWNNKPLEALIEETEKEQRYNEGSQHRIIGITLETRPDAITPKTIMHMRQQGCTRVELGLQATDDRILELIKRGHTVDQFRKAIYLLRSAGFKVDLHFMPDLPGTTPTHDVEMYKELFDDRALRPDMVKIYPNTVIKTAELHEWYLDGRYKPYGDKALFDALLQMKKLTPRYCRISRLIRDFPATEIEAGNIITNLRELLAYRLKQTGETCVCLRCREISRHTAEIPAETHPQLFIEKYDTIGGVEYFLTFEDSKRIAVFGFLRLRIPDESDAAVLGVLPELSGCAFIRELHVYGQMVEIGKTDERASQHKGLGKKLVQAAEKIVDEANFKKIAVISGVGVRGYYRKLGYRRVKTYMIKKLA